MRKEFKVGILVLLCVALAAVATDQSGSAPTLSQSKAEQIAQEYFLSNYAVEVSSVRIERERMGEIRFWNCLRASDGQREYVLLLDGQNHPYADDVKAWTALARFDPTVLEGRLEPLGLSFASAAAIRDQGQYKAVLFLDVTDLPLEETADGLWSILEELRWADLDELCLTVYTPKALRQGGYGTQLLSGKFAVTLTRTAFQTVYTDFCAKSEEIIATQLVS